MVPELIFPPSLKLLVSGEKGNICARIMAKHSAVCGVGAHARAGLYPEKRLHNTTL